jgi:hypothetical protein
MERIPRKADNIAELKREISRLKRRNTALQKEVDTLKDDLAIVQSIAAKDVPIPVRKWKGPRRDGDATNIVGIGKIYGVLQNLSEYQLTMVRGMIGAKRLKWGDGNGVDPPGNRKTRQQPPELDLDFEYGKPNETA